MSALTTTTTSREPVLFIPVDIVTSIIFKFLLYVDIVKLRLVSREFQNLVDVTYWQCHPFRLHVKPTPDKKRDSAALGRLFSGAKINCCDCIYDGESYPSPTSHVIPQILEEESIFSNVRTFHVTGNERKVTMVHNEIPEWLVPRIVALSHPWVESFCHVKNMAQLSSLYITLPEDVSFSSLLMENPEGYYHCLERIHLNHFCYLTVDDNIVRKLARLKKLKHLTMTNMSQHQQTMNFDNIDLAAGEMLALETMSLKSYSARYRLFMARPMQISMMETLVKLTLRCVRWMTSLSLSDMPNLKVLKVSYCENLVSVENCPLLRKLNIFNCTDFVRISGLPMLTFLTLTCGIRKRFESDDRVDLVVSDMPYLSELNIDWTVNVALKKNHVNLRRLSLQSCHFKNMRNTETAENTKITAMLLNHMPCLQVLRLFHCCGGFFGPEMTMLHNLKRLELIRCDIDSLCCLPNLEFLLLDDCDFASEPVFTLPNLRSLDINVLERSTDRFERKETHSNMINKFAFSHDLKSLKSLRLTHRSSWGSDRLSSIQASWLEHLESLYLCIRRKDVSLFPYECLESCRHLKHLCIQDEFVPALKTWCTQSMRDTLVRLDLSDCKYEFQTIEHFSNLKYLSLTNVHVLDYIQLQHMPNLIHLDVTSMGEERILVLDDLPRLESYTVTVNGVSRPSARVMWPWASSTTTITTETARNLDGRMIVF